MSGAVQRDRSPAVVIGDALIDEMRSEAGSTDAAGGSALNVAVGLAILGTPATLVAMIGDDPDGHTLIAHLAEHAVPLIPSPSPLGTGRAVSDRTDGEPRYSFTAAMLSRTLEFSPPVIAAIDAAPAIAVSGYPFDDQREADALFAATEASRDRLLIDPNPRSGMLNDVSRFRRNLERLAAGAALVKIGEEDAELLYRDSLANVAQRFIALGARTVLATAGAGGARIVTGGLTVDRPIAVRPQPIIDTMGAGDATFAAVIAGLVRSPAWPDAERWGEILERAMGVAAATIRHPGGLLRQE